MSGVDGTSGHGGWTPGPAAGGGAHPFDDGRPKFATFETGPNGMAVEPKKVNDDALPPMPSWEGASKRKVSIEEEPVPLQNLDPATGQKVPLMSGGAISRTGTPVASPYGQQGQYQNGSAAMVAGGKMNQGGRPQDTYRQNSNVSRGPGGYQNDPYANRGQSPGNYPPQHAPYNPPFSADVYGGGQSQAPTHRYDNFSPNPNQGYGQDRGPSSMQCGSFDVLGGANAYAQPQRNLSAGGRRPYPMGRELSDASTNHPMTNPSGPLESRGFDNNDGGYARAESPPPMDDPYGAGPGVGYSQPQISYTGSTAPPSYVSRAPANQYGGNTRYYTIEMQAGEEKGQKESRRLSSSYEKRMKNWKPKTIPIPLGYAYIACSIYKHCVCFLSLCGIFGVQWLDDKRS